MQRRPLTVYIGYIWLEYLTNLDLLWICYPISNILTAIMALYSKPLARVYLSVVLSSPFTISNRTRQGCPLSPLIFNLLMEPLAIYIRNHPDIKGFPAGDTVHTISLFADDIIMIMTEVHSSLPAAHETLDIFNHISY